jgi:hypothetical protein
VVQELVQGGEVRMDHVEVDAVHRHRSDRC